MRKLPPRPLTDAERALVGHMLDAAHVDLTPPSHVVAHCECGCASVDFIDDTSGARRIADALGRTSSGIDVGAILWAKESIVAGLEIYMLGTDTSELPVPHSLRFEP